MTKLALTQTEHLEAYLKNLKFPVKYESFEDCFIISLRDQQQIFWFGFGYNKYLNDNHI